MFLDPRKQTTVTHYNKVPIHVVNVSVFICNAFTMVSFVAVNTLTLSPSLGKFFKLGVKQIVCSGTDFNVCLIES